VKLYSSPKRPFRRGNVLTSSAALFFLLFFSLNVFAQEDVIPKTDGIPNGNDSPDFSGISQGNSSSKKSTADQGGSPSKKNESENNGLSNLVATEKSIKAYGWGEYKVGGRCLCCDNSLDGDCIIVQGTNRTDKVRIKQIVDGQIAADTGDKTTYFGDVMERENPVPVSLLMTEITFKKMFDIYAVVVYTMMDEERKRNFLSNCELGYYDQFDRLQWAGKAESKWPDDHITFEMEKPIFTKSLLLKVKGGKSRITEVDIYGKKITE
jgi:hypothetical protein